MKCDELVMNALKIKFLPYCFGNYVRIINEESLMEQFV